MTMKEYTKKHPEYKIVLAEQWLLDHIYNDNIKVVDEFDKRLECEDSADANRKLINNVR